MTVFSLKLGFLNEKLLSRFIAEFLYLFPTDLEEMSKLEKIIVFADESNNLYSLESRANRYPRVLLGQEASKDFLYLVNCKAKAKV